MVAKYVFAFFSGGVVEGKEWCSTRIDLVEITSY